MSHKTNSWEEEDVKRGKKQQREGHLGHARALFDDAHGSYNYDGHNSTGAEHHDGHPFKNVIEKGGLKGMAYSANRMEGTLYNTGMINHPAKMNDYGEPAPMEVTESSQKELMDGATNEGFANAIAKQEPARMSEDLSKDLLGADMNLTGQGYAQDEGGNTRMMPSLKDLYGMRK